MRLIRLRAAWLNGLGDDLAAAARRWRRRPGSALALAVTLSLGLGGAMGVYNAAEPLFGSPLPFYQPERLVVADNSSSPFLTDVYDFRPNPSSGSVFSASAEYRVGTDFLVTGATTHPLTTAWVTPQFFPVLGVRMALGRNLAGATTPRPDQHIASLPVVVSYAIWRDRLGSDPDALGRVIRLKRTYPYRLVVIGVAPAAFDFPPGADLWLPEHLGSFSRIQTAAPPAQLRTTVARLRPGVSRLQAEAAMRSWPHNGRDWIWNDSVRLVSMREFLGGPLYGLAVPVGAAVGLFLLLTVATATGMWRNDLASRRHEISVRQSFGALPSRLLRSTAMELSVVLAGALLLAIGIDVVATRLVSAGFGTAASPAGRLWVADALGAVVVLGVTGGLMLLALVGPMTRLRPPPVSAIGLGHAVSVGIATFTIALAVALVGASLRLGRMSSGVRDRNVFVSVIYLPTSEDSMEQPAADSLLSVDAYTRVYNARVRDFQRLMGLRYSLLLDYVRGREGINRAGVISSPPYNGYPQRSTDVFVSATPSVPEGTPYIMAHPASVTPGALQALGVKLLYGRFFGAAAGGNRGLAVVNRALARTVGPGAAALGHYITVPQDEVPMARIVGIVGDVHEQNLLDRPLPTVYYPFGSYGRADAALVVHTTASVPARAVRSVIQHAASRVMPGATVASFRSLSAMVGAATTPTRFVAYLLLVLALPAVLMAGSSAWAECSFELRRRRREVGIRVALGASTSQLVGTYLRRSLAGTSTAGALGAILAWWSSEAIGGLFLGQPPSPSAYWATALATAAFVALIMVWTLQSAAGRNPCELIASPEA